MTEKRLAAHLTRLLLRYYRAGNLAGTGSAQRTSPDDRGLLRVHWALAREVGDLCAYVYANRHEVQAALRERQRTDDAMIRGRMDARRTILARALSGHPTRVVSYQPERSYVSGPNHVLVWVLQHAGRLVREFLRGLPHDATYHELAVQRESILSSISRLSRLSDTIAEVPHDLRPAPSAVRQAARSRAALYRSAHAAYDALNRVERHDPEAVERTLSATLVAPLYEWQMFELALALGMAESLHRELGEKLDLRPIGGGPGEPLAIVGDYSVYWQWRTKAWVDPVPEPSEARAVAILNELGLQVGSDRPDVVVFRHSDGRVVAIGEAKYYTGDDESARGALRGAVDQVVRYARGYPQESPERLIRDAVIAVWRRPEGLAAAAPSAPFVMGFDDLVAGGIGKWAARVARV